MTPIFQRQFQLKNLNANIEKNTGERTGGLVIANTASQVVGLNRLNEHFVAITLLCL